MVTMLLIHFGRMVPFHILAIQPCLRYDWFLAFRFLSIKWSLHLEWELSATSFSVRHFKFNPLAHYCDVSLLDRCPCNNRHPISNHLTNRRAVLGSTTTTAATAKNLCAMKNPTCLGYGYYPLTLGQQLTEGKLEIVRKLGWASYSSVWLAQSLKVSHWRRESYISFTTQS